MLAIHEKNLWNVTKRSLREIESRDKLVKYWYVNKIIACIGVSPWVPSLKEKSLVFSLFVDNDGMIEIHTRYHRRHSSKIVKPRPISKQGKCVSKRNLGRNFSKYNLQFAWQWSYTTKSFQEMGIQFWAKIAVDRRLAENSTNSFTGPTWLILMSSNYSKTVSIFGAEITLSFHLWMDITGWTLHIILKVETSCTTFYYFATYSFPSCPSHTIAWSLLTLLKLAFWAISTSRSA